jgi:hypothetical protein
MLDSHRDTPILWALARVADSIFISVRLEYGSGMNLSNKGDIK